MISSFYFCESSGNLAIILIASKLKIVFLLWKHRKLIPRINLVLAECICCEILSTSGPVYLTFGSTKAPNKVKILQLEFHRIRVLRNFYIKMVRKWQRTRINFLRATVKMKGVANLEHLVK